MNDANLTSGAVYGTRRPLAVALALALGVSVGVAAAVGLPAAHAGGRPEGGATWPVTQCGDSGAGSLRDVLAGAAPGDIVDLGALSCGTISLTSGAIAVGQHGLTLRGPGAAALALAGSGADRVLRHTGTGTLTIEGLTVRGGAIAGTDPDVTMRGGCIDSDGSVVLTGATVRECSVSAMSQARGGCIAALGATLTDSHLEACRVDVVDGASYAAAGGALFVDGSRDLALVRSTVTGNEVSSPLGGALGGGVYVGYGVYATSSVTVTDSSLSGNRATGRPYAAGYGYFTTDQGMGGAIMTHNHIRIERSTLSDNHAGTGGALAMIGGDIAADRMVLINSTVSGNTAQNTGGGLWTLLGGVRLTNSTIAFNDAGYGAGGLLPQHPLFQGVYDFPPRIESSIVAANTTVYGIADIDTQLPKLVITGSGNLIGASSLTVPPDTLAGDPRLLPLADNDGPTLTHALAADSPALDAGFNPENLEHDQRGEGHARLSGAAVDIGAFERAVGDAIFSDGFD
ncbi:MAG: hypothetical protein DI564_04115 [Rhodanobacter denitrificans]|uniref:Right handed beta helix domain-containing protein n=1 Tax=Rhodanobacter denitrificans TaxID=666685 RepID=A0A2W5MLG9_9GAMM|nr:MAG: hypothetical protein DI564_04115 [Rhodanobacter denitrificans]